MKPFPLPNSALRKWHVTFSREGVEVTRTVDALFADTAVVTCLEKEAMCNGPQTKAFPTGSLLRVRVVEVCDAPEPEQTINVRLTWMLLAEVEDPE